MAQGKQRRNEQSNKRMMLLCPLQPPPPPPAPPSPPSPPPHPPHFPHFLSSTLLNNHQVPPFHQSVELHCSIQCATNLFTANKKKQHTFLTFSPPRSSTTTKCPLCTKVSNVTAKINSQRICLQGERKAAEDRQKQQDEEAAVQVRVLPLAH